MALIQTSLIWVTYAICLAILALISGIFVFIYQKPRERGPLVTVVCFITTLSLLATILLLPVDVALTSSTTNAKLGAKKSWATPDAVDNIVLQLKVVYYTLYSVDAVLCLLVVPFTYFWYEEYDEVAAEEGTETIGSRTWAAAKYTVVFLLLIIVLFLVGFFVPIAKKAAEEHRDLDYFKDLITQNHGERALTFAVGVLILVGTLLYCLYTAPGLALLPLTLIKSAPSISAPQLAASTSGQLVQNRERQRQLEARNEGSEGGLSQRDQRELEALVREERTLIRRERLAAETQGEGHSLLVRIWIKTEAIFRPLKLIGGLLLLAVSILVVISMLLTMVDKIKNSVCRSSCGFLLGETQIFNPLNSLLALTARVFPIDYVIFLLLTLLFFCSAVVGVATIGIRFLWVTIFRIRKGQTAPNAMLLATVLLTLMAFAFNYALAMIVSPQYATFGSQTFCDRPSHHPDQQSDCSNHKSAIKRCSERSNNPVAHTVCTPSVVSTFLNRIAVDFPALGVIIFWAQFAFLGVFVIVFIVMLFRVPQLDERQLDDDLRDEEEEGLLASTGRRFGATWQDITGRARGVNRSDYGALSGNDDGDNSNEHRNGARN